jgi:ribonuclease P protein component
MSSAPHRLSGSAQFSLAIRTGRRAGSNTLVLHLAVPDVLCPDSQDPPRVGFVVSRAVGKAVTRNRVRRRLRELVRDQGAALPSGAVLVVRALPPSAAASYAELRDDLARCLTRVIR